MQRPQDWPPFPLYGFDNGVDEGWYGYRLSSVDLFGRHSALGPAARWCTVGSPASAEAVVLYRSGGLHRTPYAVGFGQDSSSSPNGFRSIRAGSPRSLPPADAAYDAWFATLSAAEKTAVIGLRVRWNWTDAHMRQAPDTKEFRIYYRGGRLNATLGRTTAVSSASATESFVETDIPNSYPADTFAGCSLKTGSVMFRIVGSDAGSPLRLRVANIGPLDDIAPEPSANCEINVPGTHALFVDYSRARMGRTILCRGLRRARHARRG